MVPSIFQNDHAGREEFLRLAAKAVQWVSDYYREIETFPVRSQVDPGDIYKFFPEFPPEQPVDADEVFDVLNKVILPGITHWQHPNFYAFFPGNTSFPSIIGEIITAGIAAQCMIWESSPAAAELEQRCMEWCRDLLGLPSAWAGVIQDTASTATLTSILTAREWKTDFSIAKQGFDGKTYRIYTSNEAHSSVEKAVRLAGIGTDNLIRIPTKNDLSLDTSELIKAIETDLSAGYIPVCIISTIGTTPTGAIDPIGEISKIAQAYNIWHHVDAAYAGTALMLEEYAHLREGLEGADSFVFNPHKWMFVQFDCTAYFVRDPELLVRTMSVHPSYLMTSQGNTVNDYRDWGIPLGRRFRALKLWITLQLLGTAAIKERLRHHIRLADQLEKYFHHDDLFELAYPRNFNIVTFRVKRSIDPEGDTTRKLCSMINESGAAYMTHATVEGRSLIRWVTGQTYVQHEHVYKTWKQVRDMAEKILM